MVHPTVYHFSFIALSYSKKLLKSEPAVVYQLCCAVTEVADVPRLIHIACDISLSLRISDDEAVFVTMRCKPLSLGGLAVALIERGYIHREPRLMLRMSRLCGVCLCDLIAIDRAPVSKGALLLLIGAEA